MEVKINIIKPFEYWYSAPKRLKIAFGGRGGGKSECIIRMLIAKSFEKKNAVILCARETQKSISDSIYSLIIDVINILNLIAYFYITKTEIINKITNTKFIFKGLRECGIENIKSIHNIQICFIEEGQTITQRSYEVLDPSIRGKDSEIWIAFNPRFSTDVIYTIVFPLKFEDAVYTDNENKEYPYKKYEDKDKLALFINYDGNYFFSKELEQSRRMSLEMMPTLYRHIWLGEIKKEQGRIFLKDKLRFYDETAEEEQLQYYIKKAVIDPAFGQENCFTSCLIYIQIGKDIYLIDSGLMRNNANSTTDELIENFLIKNDIKEIMCESNFAQNELVKKLKRRFNVKPFFVRINKIDRIVNASYSIYERVLFPLSWLDAPKEYNTEKWIDTKQGRGFTALQQLFNFSDIKSNNCIQGDDFSYIDFPDVLASLVYFGSKNTYKQSNNEYITFNDNLSSNHNRQEIDDRIKQIKNKRNIEIGFGFGLNR